MALSIETKERGGRTLNLRISHEASRKALSSGKGPVGFMQNRVRETFKRRFADDAPEFWFVMEMDNDNLFHLHGAYVSANHIDHRLIDGALRSAGGWGSDKAVGLSQVSKPLVDPVWWAWYCVKSINLTADMTDRKLFASTAPLRDAARGGWDRVRGNMPQGKKS